MGLRTFLGLKKRPVPINPLQPIGGVRPPLWRREYQRNFPGGDWTERFQQLLDLAIDYRGQTILDAGCNLGITGYEISKFRPAFYHGIDSYRPGLEVARAIFTGVSVPHRFDRVDMGRADRLARALEPKYDIVLLLRVYHHIVRAHGADDARRMLALLASRCQHLLVATCQAGEEEADIVNTMKTGGFAVRSTIPSDTGRIYNWYLFERA